MDWNSSALWGIIGLIGGIIVTSFFYFIGLKRKCMSYYIDTFTIISNKANQITDLEIKYHDNKLNHLYLSKITITNIGNCIIEYQDFASTYLPFLYTDGEFLIDFASGSVLSDEVKDFKITYNGNYDINKLNLNFDYLAKDQEIILSIFHTGDISFNGKLKDGKIIQLPKETKLEKISFNLLVLSIHYFFVTIIACIFAIYYNNSIIFIALFVSNLFITIADIIKYFIKRKKRKIIY